MQRDRKGLVGNIVQQKPGIREQGGDLNLIDW